MGQSSEPPHADRALKILVFSEKLNSNVTLEPSIFTTTAPEKVRLGTKNRVGLCLSMRHRPEAIRESLRSHPRKFRRTCQYGSCLPKNLHLPQTSFPTHLPVWPQLLRMQKPAFFQGAWHLSRPRIGLGKISECDRSCHGRIYCDRSTGRRDSARPIRQGKSSRGIRNR